MMIDLHLGDSEAEIQCFQSALHSIFHGEPWEVIEPHARRAWCVGQFADGAAWEEVRDRIRDSLFQTQSAGFHIWPRIPWN